MDTTSRTTLLGEHNVKKVLIQLTIPATIGMVVNALYNLIDTLFVGLGAGEIAIGALGFAFPVQIIIMAFELTDKPIEPKIILVDKDNKFVKYL